MGKDVKTDATGSPGSAGAPSGAKGGPGVTFRQEPSGSTGATSRLGRSSDNAKNAVADGLGILFWLAVWFAAAALVGNDLLLAGPAQTTEALLGSFADAAFWQAVGTTTARILAAGTLSAAAGVVLGALAYRFSWGRHLMSAPLQVMKSAPVACVIVVVLVAWGANGALVAIVAFVALPPFYVAMTQALKSRPRDAETVLGLAGVPRARTFAGCIWPSALPFFTAASKTAVALSWRAGITAELLCLPMGTIGSAVYASKLTLDSAQLLALTVVVMVLSWVCEKAVVALLGLTGRLARRAAVPSARTTSPTTEGATASIPASGAPVVAAPAPVAASPAPAASECAPTTAASLSSIVLDQASKEYGAHQALGAFALRVDPSERVCLMAPTGSGKSTAIRLMLHAEKPDAGSVQSPARIGAVLQTPSLVDGLTTFENVSLAAGRGVTDAQVADALAHLLPAGALEKTPTELSGGMKRLAEIARAMLSDGEAIVLDEPFAGLDEESHARVCAFILDNLHGRPLVVATHDPVDAELLDARIARL